MRILIVLVLLVVSGAGIASDISDDKHPGEGPLIKIRPLPSHSKMNESIKTSFDILKKYKGMTALSWQEFAVHGTPRALFVWFDADPPQISRTHHACVNVFYHNGEGWRSSGFFFAPHAYLVVALDRNKRQWRISDRSGKVHHSIAFADLQSRSDKMPAPGKVEQPPAGDSLKAAPEE